MSKHYSARIIENGKARQTDCYAYKPADALQYLLRHAHISEDATVQLATAFWKGDTYVSAIYTYCHIPELDEECGSAWHIVGVDYVRHFVAEPE